MPFKVAEYQYVQLEVGCVTTIRLDETHRKAYKRAWKVVEKEMGLKMDEYTESLKSD